MSAEWPGTYMGRRNLQSGTRTQAQQTQDEMKIAYVDEPLLLDLKKICFTQPYQGLDREEGLGMEAL